MTIYEYFNELTSQGLGLDHSEEFEDAIMDTLSLIQQSSLADIESGEEAWKQGHLLPHFLMAQS